MASSIDQTGQPSSTRPTRHNGTNSLSRPIRILLVDDQALMRQGLRTLLEHEPGLQVVGEASSQAEALSLTSRLNPDLVLLEIVLAGRPDSQLITNLLRQRPNMCILVLTTVDDERTAMRVLEAGVQGYLLKSSPFSDLVQAIQAAMRGGTPLHPRIARAVLRRLRQPPAAPDPLPKLTTREREVLHLLAQGYSNREIARILVITQFTVRTHVCRLLKKLNLANRTQAALYFIHQNSGSPATNGPEERAIVFRPQLRNAQ